MITEKESELQDLGLASAFSSTTEICPGGLRRVRDKMPGRLWVVALIGFWERAAFWGLLAPWR